MKDMSCRAPTALDHLHEVTGLDHLHEFSGLDNLHEVTRRG